MSDAGGELAREARRDTGPMRRAAPSEAGDAGDAGDAGAVRDAIEATMRRAIERRAPLRIVGRGTWLDAGRPVAATDRLDVGALRGIVEYVPGDLTLTARAGTSLAEIDAAVRAEGQWLALDPPGGDAGSLGATIATASAGPASHAAGTPRDNVLGVEFLTGAGEIVRGGGRVVKNVAGFDLVRLTTGAWGTLGAILEVTVRLRALPAVDETVALALPAGDGRLADHLAAVRSLSVAPVALEITGGALPLRLGLPGPAILVRLAGNEALVRAQRATLARLGELAPAPADAWRLVRAPEPAGAVVARFSAAPSRLGAVWQRASRLAHGDGWVHATMGRGVARVVAPAPDLDRLEDVVNDARAAGISVLFERLPADAWPRLAPSVADERLQRGVRAAFDPHHLLNRGILGERVEQA